MSSVTHYAATVGALSRSRTPHDPELVEARRNLRVERTAEHIRKLLDGWPAPMPDQLDRLALLLRDGSS